MPKTARNCLCYLVIPAAQDAAWSPTDDRIATASQDRTAKIWDAKTGREVITLTGHANTVTAIELVAGRKTYRHRQRRWNRPGVGRRQR